MMTRTAATALLALGLLSAGCGADDEGTSDSSSCNGGKCDAADDNVLDVLAERNDPIAVFLRDVVDEQGHFEIEYIDMLERIAGQEGCDRSSIDAYVISDELVVAEGEEAFPRVVSTVCSTDRTKADRAFFALSFAKQDRSDIDTHRIEMFAWDPDTEQYNFYETFPSDDGSPTGRLVSLNDTECQGCHKTPMGVDDRNMPMTPIMNELSAPWEHWFAEPVSMSHFVPDGLDSAPLYSELAGNGSEFRKSAARLEQTIVSAFNQRVGNSRINGRRTKHGAGDEAKQTSAEQAMSLLRPLFCSEQLTYATEDGSSGLLLAGAVVDDGWHSVFFQKQGTGWPWEWWNDRKLRLDPPGAPDAVSMIPMRGASVVAYEKNVLSRRALTPEQVARARALDWHNPALSDFRCGLFHNALERMRAPGGLDDLEYDETKRVLHVMRDLYDGIFEIHPGDFGLALEAPVSLIAAGDSFVAISDADDATVADMVAALAGEGLPECTERGEGACVTSLMAMGDILEAYFKSMESGGRDAINALRNARGCEVDERFPNKPFIKNLDCTQASEPEPEPDPMPEPDPTTGGDTDGGTGGGDTGTPPSAGNCCEPRDAELGCENQTVQECVCAQDSFCCESGWDQVCVDEIAEFGCSPGCG
jgi:hypothetical protein